MAAEVLQIGVSISSQTDIAGISNLLSWSQEIPVSTISPEDTVDLPVIIPSKVPITIAEVN